MLKICFEITQEKFDEMNSLVIEAGLESRKDLVNEALSAYEWMLSQKKEGRIIASIEDKGDKHVFHELVFPTRKAKEAVN